MARIPPYWQQDARFHRVSPGQRRARFCGKPAAGVKASLPIVGALGAAKLGWNAKATRL